MHTEDHKDPLIELGYEQKDINPKNIFKVSMFFFGFAFFSFFLGWAMLSYVGYFKDSKGVNDVMSTKIPKSPNPILQTNVTAKTDIIDMRRRENEVLATSGKSDFVKGANRISIEQAIKLAAERGAKLTSEETIGGPK
jgi:hypothetical protein